MFGWLRRKKAAVWGDPAEPFRRLQEDYWRFDSEQKSALLARYPSGLSWPELLRLHHLACLELLAAGRGDGTLQGTDADDEAVAQLPAAALCRELAERLLAGDSPYRPAECALWRGSGAQSRERDADLRGLLRNASLTHLGCLEAIRLDARHNPRELVFIPLTEIRAALLAQPSLFRAAKIRYHDGREETVSLPLLYGISWRSPHAFDRDGTMTRFRCQIAIGEGQMRTGIGVGHQDFVLAADGHLHLLGLAAIGEIIRPA